MAVPENAGVKKISSSGQTVDSNNGNVPEKQKPNKDQPFKTPASVDFDCDPEELNGEAQVGQMSNGIQKNGLQIMANGLKSDDETGDLSEMLSKLNPMAEEFVPPSLVYKGINGSNYGYMSDGGVGFGYANNFVMLPDAVSLNGLSPRRKKNNYSHGGKRRINARTSMAQREEVIKRTLYVSDIDQQVTEEQLAAIFNNCGQVVDCRVCGDPNSCLRFAFIEFTDEEAAKVALGLRGTMLGYYPLNVMPSKTAIAPVNPTYLPRSEDEREMCTRTIYCTNIDKKVTHLHVKTFFESLCGEVRRLRLLGDYRHATRIAFVEFVMAEDAILALGCSGAMLGSEPIRVSPSKTPVRTRMPRLDTEV